MQTYHVRDEALIYRHFQPAALAYSMANMVYEASKLNGHYRHDVAAAALDAAVAMYDQDVANAHDAPSTYFEQD